MSVESAVLVSIKRLLIVVAALGVVIAAMVAFGASRWSTSTRALHERRDVEADPHTTSS